jgi:hypothetical protein
VLLFTSAINTEAHIWPYFQMKLFFITLKPVFEHNWIPL